MNRADSLRRNHTIQIFVTGGTFDKEYDYIHGKLFFKETHLPEMFKVGRATVDIRVRTLMMIDSLEMTDEHRDLISHACIDSPEEQIIVTHGTDTMVQTAHTLARRVKGKTVVLTGAMIPYKFGSSDGFFNLGSALAFVQTLPHGVYVVMNGRFFDWDNVQKNISNGLFEEIMK